jgi:hypothetical protein
MSDVVLENRDYTVIVAKTAPSIAMMPPGYEHRWAAAYSAIVALVQTCERLDPDGITIYISCNNHPEGSFKRYGQVTPDQIDSIFQENYPPDRLKLLDGLEAALEEYFVRKAAHHSKPNGEMIIVLVDGEPLDRMTIAKTITQAAAKLDSDDELGIGFAHIGDDLIARGFFAALDEDLRSQTGAKFDIVHTQVLEEIKPDCLTNFLIDIIRD